MLADYFKSCSHDNKQLIELVYWHPYESERAYGLRFKCANCEETSFQFISSATVKQYEDKGFELIYHPEWNYN